MTRIWVSAYSYGQWENLGPADYWYTNSTGHLVRTVTNDSTDGWCSDKSKYYLGVHRWYGGSQDDLYVFSNVTDPINFTLQGSLMNTLFSVSNHTVEDNQNMTVVGNVKDDCGADMVSIDTFFSRRRLATV